MHYKPYYVIKKDDEEDAGEHGSVMAHVKARMDNPPSTWASYHDKPGGMISIVEMEYRELMEEKTEGSTSGIKKELTDLAAACIHTLKKM